MSVKLRSKTKSDGSKSYYLDIYHNGNRQYEFLKIYISKNDKDRKEKKTLAENIRSKRELEIQTHEHGFIPTFKKNADFIEYCEAFLLNYQKAGVRKFKYALEKFKKFWGKKRIPFKSVTPKLCEQFKDYLLSAESGLEGETPFDYFKRFRTVLNQATDEGIFIKNPAKGIKIRRQNNQLKKEVLVFKELQLLTITPCGNEEVKRAFLFACFTGLGEAEIRKLTWGRIHNNKIKLFREKSGEQIILDLNQAALSVLGEKRELDEYVFSLPSAVAVSKNLRNWMKRAGISKKITFYCGRHTFATQLLKSGANLKTVADCLGHTSTHHTVKYLNYVDALKSEALYNLPQIEYQAPLPKS